MPLFFSSPRRSLLPHSPWVAPVLSLPLKGPCFSNPLGFSCSLYCPGRPRPSNPLGRPLFFLFLWKSPVPPSLGCSWSLSCPGRPRPDPPTSFPGRPLFLLLTGISLLFLLPWKAPVSPAYWDLLALSPPLEGPCFSCLLGSPCSFSSGPVHQITCAPERFLVLYFLAPGLPLDCPWTAPAPLISLLPLFLLLP
jgi:hypothetical protein